MSFIRAIGREVRGTWRSIRYDLRRSPRRGGGSPAVRPWSERGVRSKPRPAEGRRGAWVVTLAVLVLLAVGISGGWAVAATIRPLLDPGAPPADLPAYAGTHPEPTATTDPVVAVSPSPSARPSRTARTPASGSTCPCATPPAATPTVPVQPTPTRTAQATPPAGPNRPPAMAPTTQVSTSTLPTD